MKLLWVQVATVVELQLNMQIFQPVVLLADLPSKPSEVLKQFKYPVRLQGQMKESPVWESNAVWVWMMDYMYC